MLCRYPFPVSEALLCLLSKEGAAVISVFFFFSPMTHPFSPFITFEGTGPAKVLPEVFPSSFFPPNFACWGSPRFVFLFFSFRGPSSPPPGSSPCQLSRKVHAARPPPAWSRVTPKLTILSRAVLDSFPPFPESFPAHRMYSQENFLPRADFFSPPFHPFLPGPSPFFF